MNFKSLITPGLLTAWFWCASSLVASGQDPPNEFIWPDLAPGELTRATGTAPPPRETDSPTITRVEKIGRPSLDIYPATARPNGSAVLILPGGGFRYVVTDLEGSEASEWLGEMGFTTFVLRYRTTPAGGDEELRVKRVLQDSQRAMRWIRENKANWNLDSDRIGLLAFSAGGQVGARLITTQSSSYEEMDQVDQHSFRPDFAMLVYPWRIYDQKTDALLPQIKVDSQTPETFLVHTHDDASSSLGAVYLYAALKKQGVPAELHVYENGGHGYGTRPRPNSNIGTWKDRASDWLARRVPPDKK